MHVRACRARNETNEAARPPARPPLRVHARSQARTHRTLNSASEMLPALSVLKVGGLNSSGAIGMRRNNRISPPPPRTRSRRSCCRRRYYQTKSRTAPGSLSAPCRSILPMMVMRCYCIRSSLCRRTTRAFCSTRWWWSELKSLATVFGSPASTSTCRPRAVQLDGGSPARMSLLPRRRGRRRR